MENLSVNQPTINRPLLLDEENKTYFKEISKWGKFIAIVGYIGVALLILLGLFFIIGFSFINNLAMPELNQTNFFTGTSYFIFMGILYIVYGIIYFFPTRYLYRFSKQINIGLNSNDSISMTAGMSNLKSLFKYIGIFTVIMLALFALIIIVAIPLAFIFAA